MAIGQAQFSLGDAVLNIVGDVSGLNKALGAADKSIKNSMGNILALGQKIGAGMTIAGGAIVGALGLSVKAAEESEAAQAQLAAVLKSTGGAAGLTATELTNMAAGLQKVTTYDDETILSAESLLLTFTKIGKEIFPEATEAVLNMSTALGQDTKSSAIQLGKALNDPIVGLTALRRVGVAFTKEQRDQIKAMVDSGNVMGAQKLILKELATEFGGSARAAAETFGGKVKQLKNQFNDLMEVVGGAIIPVLSSLAKRIAPVVQQIADWASKNKEAFANITLVVGAAGVLMVTLGPLLIALPALIAMFSGLSTVAMAVAGVFSGALALAIKGLIALIGVPAVIGIGIAGVVAGLYALFETFNNPTGFDNFLTRMIDNYLPNFGKWIDRTMDKIVNLIQKFKEFIGLADKPASSGLNPALANGPAGLAGARAGGGSINRPGAYLVGEHGPELRYFGSGGGVIDAQTTRGMMGGNQSFTINVNGQDIRSLSEQDYLFMMKKIGIAGRRASGR